MIDPAPSSVIGAVVIGRNEGERLRACLTSVIGQARRVVYVDSGSRDDSCALAASLGATVIALDPAEGFTAARARNAGVAALLRLGGCSLIQFVDGDCVLADGWIDRAAAAMTAQPQAAVICGRRRERYPAASRYNRLCDIEWNTPIGEAHSCGGDALIRLDAFIAVGGFDAALIAGEEPDLCHRLRAHGWRICRVDAEMTLHDAAMTRFGQWWQRNRRSGHASAEALARRGAADPALLRPVISNLCWSLPVAWPLWPVLWWRIRLRRGALYATYTVLGKLPHALGQVGFWLGRRAHGRATLIEYK